LKDFNPANGVSLDISTDCSLQFFSVLAATYYNQPWTLALQSDISGVDNAYFVHPNVPNTPLTSRSGVSGGITNTYKVFGIASMSVTVPLPAPTLVNPVPTMTEWGMIILVILLGVRSIYYLKKPTEWQFKKRALQEGNL